MDIIEKIKDIDCYLKDISASRTSGIPGEALKQVEIKRGVSHKFHLPKRKSDHFYVEVTDRITFGPEKGPFQIKVVIGASISLAEPVSPGEMKKLTSLQKNILSIINHCLPHSSAVIALITDKMGFSPVIFSSRIALNKKEFTDANRLSRRRTE